MSTTIGIGFSQHAHPQEAAFEACVQAKNQLQSPQTDLVILFTTIHYAQPEILEVIASVLKPKRLAGCTTGGIILTDGISNRGLAVMAMNSSDIHCGLGVIHNSADLKKTGFDLARKASGDLNEAHRQAFLVLSDGIFKNNPLFVRGIQEVLGSGFPITGAISSDQLKFNTTHQFTHNQVLTNSTVGVLIGGNSVVALGNKHGYKPLGKPRTVTKVSDSHVIRTIDGLPAVTIYEHYTGQDIDQIKKGIVSSQAMLYPLGIYIEEEKQYLIRNPIDILADGSIVCQGDVPEGVEVHLMISNKDACVQAAGEAARKVKEGLAGKQAKLVLIFESMAYHKLLGRASFAEIQTIKEVLGHTTPMLGMYSYGEIAPFGSLTNIKNTYLHNQNILIFALG